MTCGKIQRIVMAVLAALAVLAVSATPATAQTNDTEAEPSDFGSEWPPPAESGFVASAAAASDWFAIKQMPARAGGIEQSPKDGSIMYTQYDLPTSPSTQPDTIWSFNTAGPVAGYPLGSSGALEDQFDRPSDIAIDINDEFYVADAENDRVQVYDNSVSPPVFAREITGGGFGEPTGTLDCPTAVEYLEATSEVYVLTGNDEVRVYNPFGDFVRTFGTSGSGAGQMFNECQPSSLAIDGTHVFVSDCGNDRVQKFDLAGAYVGALGVGSLDCPRGIDIDDAGMLYVADNADRIQVFDAAGVYSETIGNPGTSLGELRDPLGLDVNPAGTIIWVVDRGNNRIQTFTKLQCNGENATHVGTAFADVINGSANNDVVAMGAGNDTFNGSTGDDVVCGGDGDDTMTGGGGKDMLFGEAGNDTMSGDAGDDELHGAAGNNTMNGGDGKDMLFGDAGIDTMNGDAGDDELHGAAGNDTMTGGDGDDMLFGEDGDDEMNGGDGRDRLYGGLGVDTIFGGFGIDYIYGEAGADILDGEGGSDRMYGGPDNDLIKGDSGADRMYGGSGDDDMRGMGGQDFMWGEAGNDLMQGNFQSDNMFGGPGNDMMFGAGGKDSLFGEAGDDDLNGGLNTDYLNGGDDVDTANGGRGFDKPLTEPKVRASNGQFYDGSGCIAETIVNCQPTP